MDTQKRQTNELKWLTNSTKGNIVQENLSLILESNKSCLIFTYLLIGRILDYHDPFAMRNGGLTKKKDILLWLTLFKMSCQNDCINIFYEI